MGCIYLVTNRINGRQYVGKTVRTLAERRKAHEGERGRSRYLIHRALHKYGPDAFEWEEVYSNVADEDLDRLEIECIAWFGSMVPRGYNLTTGGEGGKLVGEALERHSISTHSPTHIEAARQRALGNKRALGHRHTEEAKRKMSGAGLGRLCSPKTREKRSVSLMGHPVKPETREKLRQANLGKKQSRESIEKTAAANRGKRRSATARRNSSNGAERRYRYKDWESCCL